MPKKKHRKKTRSAKRAPHHKTPAKHSVRGRHIKSAKHSGHSPIHSAHNKPEHSSLPLLRAIKRRRAAQNGEHLEFDGMRGAGHHTHKKRSKSRQARSSHHHQGEPVITEKSFENMLAYRRFQNHAR